MKNKKTVILLFVALFTLTNSSKTKAFTIDTFYQFFNESNLDIDDRKVECYSECMQLAETLKEEVVPVKTSIEEHEAFIEIAEEYKAEEERLAQLERERLERIERERIEAEKKAEAERKAKLEVERKAKELEAKKLAQKKQQEYDSQATNSVWKVFNASYYTSGCYKCSGIAASGVDLRTSIYYNGLRVVAVDPRVIPLWSIVEVKTHYGTFKAIALDTGGRIKDRKLDILVASRSEAYELGRHDVEVRVLKQGK